MLFPSTSNSTAATGPSTASSTGWGPRIRPKNSERKAIVVIGVLVVGGQVFTDLMMAAGDSAEHAREIYQHLLALSTEVSAVYMEAYERATADIGDLHQKLASAGLPGLTPGSGWQAGTPFGDVAEPLQKAAERALEMSEKLSQGSKQVTLASLNACEAAALAVVDWQEELASSSPVDVVQTLGGMHAEVSREVTKACAASARDLLAASEF